MTAAPDGDQLSDLGTQLVYRTRQYHKSMVAVLFAGAASAGFLAIGAQVGSLALIFLGSCVGIGVVLPLAYNAAGWRRLVRETMTELARQRRRHGRY